MKTRVFGAIPAAILWAALAAAAASAEDEDAAVKPKPSRNEPADTLVRSSGVVPDPAELASHPLGTLENPVRAYLPAGEAAYLNRLVCPGGARPSHVRTGAGAIGPYANVTDIYALACPKGLRTTVVMDMYHPDTIETKPVPGFTIRGFQD